MKVRAVCPHCDNPVLASEDQHGIVYMTACPHVSGFFLPTLEPEFAKK